MSLFGPSRKERFVRNDAGNLANYLKNNAVKSGGEAYAKCQALGILPKDIDKQLLWYFWSIVYAFRVAQESVILKGIVDDETGRTLFEAFIEIDNRYFRPLEHGSYAETFASVNLAIEAVMAKSGRPSFEQASLFMLHAVKAIPDLENQDQRFTVVQALTEAAISFPSIKTIIDQNA